MTIDAYASGQFSGDRAERRPRHAPLKARSGPRDGYDGDATVTGEMEIVLRRPVVQNSDDEVRQLVLKAVKNTQGSSFRTTSSLAAELMLEVDDVRDVLAGLERDGLVRRAVATSARYQEWYADAALKLTNAERWNKFRMLAGRA